MAEISMLSGMRESELDKMSLSQPRMNRSQAVVIAGCVRLLLRACCVVVKVSDRLGVAAFTVLTSCIARRLE